jgi:hypothetical protein
MQGSVDLSAKVVYNTVRETDKEEAVGSVGKE